jgi:hypothetical protein
MKANIFFIALGLVVATVACGGDDENAAAGESNISAAGGGATAEPPSADGGVLRFAVLELTQHMLRDPAGPSSRAFASFAAKASSSLTAAHFVHLSNGGLRYVFGASGAGGQIQLVVLQSPPTPGAEGIRPSLTATLSGGGSAAAGPALAEQDRKMLRVLLAVADEAARSPTSTNAVELGRFASESVSSGDFTVAPIPGGDRFVFDGILLEDGDVGMGTAKMTIDEKRDPSPPPPASRFTIKTELTPFPR